LVKFLNITCLLIVFLWTTETRSDLKTTYSEIKSWYQKNKDNPVTFFHSDQNQIKIDQSIIQIILIRHGQPMIKKRGWYSYSGALNYIYAYDTVGVYDFDKPPVNFNSTDVVEIYSSPLPRAYDTAQKIFGDSEIIIKNSMFIEFQREIIPLPLIRLPIKGWTTLSRFFWVLGLHSSEVPSFKSERLRAKYDAQFLEMAAGDNKKVILVGHGFLNKYIVKYLKKNDWDQSYNGGSDYLSVQVMTKIIGL